MKFHCLKYNKELHSILNCVYSVIGYNFAQTNHVYEKLNSYKYRISLEIEGSSNFNDI